jgi:hypothetical protein
MSMNYTDGRPTSAPQDENDSPMFVAVPVWERGARKRRGLSRSRVETSSAPEPRTFEAPASRAQPTERPAQTVYGEAPYATAPAHDLRPQHRTAVARKRGSAAPLAIAAGVVVIGGLAVAGWYGSQSSDSGVATLTPGLTETSPAALDTANTTTLAANTAPAPAQPAATGEALAPTPVTEAEALTPPAQVARTTAPRPRPATAPSAADAGMDASASLPAAPLPYAATVGATDSAVTAPPAMSPSAAEPAPLALTPVPVAPMVTPPAPTPQDGIAPATIQ